MNSADTKYNQTFAPVREQKTAEGHSVRAVYMYTAMADIAGTTGDKGLLKAYDTVYTETCYTAEVIDGISEYCGSWGMPQI